MQTITTHYINGTFVESHGSEVMDIIKPSNRQVERNDLFANRFHLVRLIEAPPQVPQLCLVVNRLARPSVADEVAGRRLQRRGHVPRFRGGSAARRRRAVG
jgi:hypothetical protein